MQKFTTLIALPLIAACSLSPEQTMKRKPPAMQSRVSADLMQGDKNVGTVRLMQKVGGIEMAVSVAGLPAGEYAIHLHETGQCLGPDYKTAGGHWNPTMRQHGLENPQGTHAGDLPNFKIVTQGITEFYQQLDGIRLSGDRLSSESALMDADGAAVIIHAKPDDNKTDPSGNSGARMICGVLKRTS